MNYRKLKTTIAVIENSFKISGRGIVVELKHSENGLKEGTVLTSDKSKLNWTVKARILLDHAVHKQTVFDNESVEYLLCSFSSVEKKNKSIQSIVDKEKHGIFQYYLDPQDHDNKPVDGNISNIQYRPSDT